MKLLTRREMIDYIKNERGIPLTLSSYNKLAAKGRAAKPDAFYGRKELFTVETADKFAETLLSSSPANLRTNSWLSFFPATSVTSSDRYWSQE